MFEVNIRFIGGLLAAYYLSGQEVSALKWQSHAEKASLNEKKDFHPFFFPVCSHLHQSAGFGWCLQERHRIKSYVFVWPLLFFSVCSVYSALGVEPSGFPTGTEGIAAWPSLNRYCTGWRMCLNV